MYIKDYIYVIIVFVLLYGNLSCWLFDKEYNELVLN